MSAASQRYYLNADKSRVVGEDDPEAAFLLLPEGVELDSIKAEFGADIYKQVEALNKKSGAKAEDKAEDQAEDKGTEPPKRASRG